MMADPMADLGGSAPAGMMTGDDQPHSKDVVDTMILQYNLARIERIRSVMGIASGCIAGIAGLTGLQGLGTEQLYLFCVRCFFLSSKLQHIS
jgi:hypothetical protein